MILIDFYDSTEPAYMPVGSLAACYGFGPYAVQHPELARFDGHVLITDVPDDLDRAARLCRFIDVERGAAAAADVAPFIGYRLGWGHRDGGAYASLDNIPAVLEAAPEKTFGPYRLWVAWWDQPTVPTPNEIAATLLTRHRCVVDPERIWAVQYANRRHYDISRCYGAEDFVR